MLSRIQINNFLIIDNIDIDLTDSLNVITGNTGSGKSLILAAINFCLTGKIESNFITGDKLSVTLVFDVNDEIKNYFEKNNVDVEDEIIISRQISAAGKKRLTVNNQQIIQKILEGISDKLILIYGQHSFSKLFKRSTHGKLLDNFLENKNILSDISEKYKLYKSCEAELDKVKELNEKSRSEEEYLRHAYQELSDANLEENEEEILSDKRAEMKKRANYSKLISELSADIQNSEIISKLNSISRIISRSNYSENFEHISSHIDVALDNICEAENQLERMADDQFSENDLEKLENRLFEIRDLARKYNVPASNLMEYFEELEGKIKLIDNFDSKIKQLEKELSEHKENYQKLAKNLSDLRIKAASKLEKLVIAELEFLNMKTCKFKVDISTNNELMTEKGIDQISFTASTNKGTAFGPIDKIASGGEMARFMLAMQISILSKEENIPSIIFDEIDTGIGGSVADSVGDRLKKLSNLTQVFAITHQPQVAGKAEGHILISKSHKTDRTISSAEMIDGDEKTKEIARMISGKEITEKAIEAAKILIS